MIDVYVRYVRQKVDAPFAEPLIHTVRGVGYTLRAAGHGQDGRRDPAPL